MLIEFNVQNYRSFKSQQSLNLLAAKIKENENNKFKAGKLDLLKSVAIYGANASGKSNLVKAFSFMKYYIENSVSDFPNENKRINTERYLLSTITDKEPSVFEVTFIKESIRYRYGFAVTTEKVVEEWLYHVENVQETLVFERDIDGNINNPAKYKSDFKGLGEKTKKNSLFLTVLGQFNNSIALKVSKWFSNVIIMSSNGEHNYYDIAQYIKENENKKRILNYLKVADLSIEDILLEEKNIDEIPGIPQALIDEIKNNSILPPVAVRFDTIHKKYDDKNKHIDDVKFDMTRNESDGTNHFFNLIEPVDSTLIEGGVIIVDELDRSLHPLLVDSIVKMFHDPEINKNNAQLVFTTHYTKILNNESFRRDQIYFSEKTRYGETKLFSLVEYIVDGKKTRKDASYEKDYLSGKYGAVPFISDIKDCYIKFEPIDGE